MNVEHTKEFFKVEMFSEVLRNIRKARIMNRQPVPMAGKSKTRIALVMYVIG